MNVIVGICIIGVIILAMIGGGSWARPEYIYPEQYDRAVTACETNDGLLKIEMDVRAYEAHCNNGAMFRLAVSNN